MNKKTIEELLSKLRSYVDNIMSGYGRVEKELAFFEKEHMRHYADDMPLRQSTFRLFLRMFTSDEVRWVENTGSKEDVRIAGESVSIVSSAGEVYVNGDAVATRKDIQQGVTVVQTTGAGTAAVMSQRAVTEELGKRAAKSDLTGLATKEELTELATKEEVKKAVSQVRVPAVVQTMGAGTAAVMSQRAVTEELGKRATKSDLTGLATKSDLTGLAAKSDLTGLATKSDLTNYVLKSELPTPVVLAGQGEAPLVPGVLGVRVNENGSVMLFQGGRASSLVSHYIRRGAVGETVTTVATKANTWGADGLEIIPAADATYGYTWEAVVTTWVGGMTICVHRITSVAQWMGRTYMRVIVEKIG